MEDLPFLSLQRRGKEGGCKLTCVTTRIFARLPYCRLCRWASDDLVSNTICHPGYMALIFNFAEKIKKTCNLLRFCSTVILMEKAIYYHLASPHSSHKKEVRMKIVSGRLQYQRSFYWRRF